MNGRGRAAAPGVDLGLPVRLLRFRVDAGGQLPRQDQASVLGLAQREEGQGEEVGEQVPQRTGVSVCTGMLERARVRFV